jgi:hypothetical protein
VPASAGVVADKFASSPDARAALRRTTRENVAAFAAGMVICAIAIPAAAFGRDQRHHGVVNPEVTQQNIYQTICDARWRKLERPSRRYTDKIKKRWARQQGVDKRDYELDHIVPLCAGGAPYSEENLQLQPWPEAREKNGLEERTCKAICDGSISLRKGQGRFRQ